MRGLHSPILDLSRWFSENILRQSFHQAAREGEQAYLLFDEVQNLADWAPQLKYLVDMNPVRVLVTGSSALRIEAGRDSLAGRISTLEMGPLLLREIAELRRFGSLESFLPHNGLGPLKQKETWLDLRRFGEEHAEQRRLAFDANSDRGAYPEAHTQPDRWSARPQEAVPLTPESLLRSPHLVDLAERRARSAVGYFLCSIPGLDVAHFPERSTEPEVDFVLTVGEQRIPLEVKYRRRIEHRDTFGLRSFLEKAHYNAPFGLLVTLLDEPASDDPRIVSLPLSSLLLLR